MNDLIGHLLGFRRLLTVIVGSGLLLLLLLSTVALNETGMAILFVLVASVLVIASVAAIYLRLLSKASSEVRTPPPEWERERNG
jgi:hypothetical protein